MATDTFVKPESLTFDPGRSAAARTVLPGWLWKSLEAIASLKLTVVLFLLSIVLVYAGTLAQVERDVLDVVHGYFRTVFVLIPLQVFFPVTFFPSLDGKVPGVLPFPGGITIGAVMAANLLAAHAIRFKVQARGARLFGGFAVLALGLVCFALAVASGMSNDGILEDTLIPWATMWRICVGLLVLTCTAMAFGVVQMDPSRSWERLLLGTAAVGLGAATFWLVLKGDSARLDDSGMRILWQLSKGLGVALVLLMGCYLLFKKRAGVVLLHGGIGLVMASEVIVSFWAVEGQMRMREGQTVNFVSDVRTVELAVTDRTNADHDTVVAIPKSRLENVGAVIKDARLPFDIEILRYFENSAFVDVGKAKENLADHGLGLKIVAREAALVSGTDTDGEMNVQSAYVRLRDKKNGADLGTYLLNVNLSLSDMLDTVPVGDKQYDVELRHRRTYKPYSLTLLDVRKDDYVGTETPKDYSSDIHLLDPERKIDRSDVHIWMNNPLRFAGETFYQSGFYRDPQTQAEYTTLSVVSNFGWMIPYIGCMIVGTGMFWQFMNTLSRFLGRLDREEVKPRFPVPRAEPTGASKRERRREQEYAVAAMQDTRRGKVGLWVATAVVALAALYVTAGAMRPVKKFENMDLAAFGNLPVAHQGRVKPMDTFARNQVRIFGGKLEFNDKDNVRQPAIRWLADVLARPEVAFTHKVFRIDHEELLRTLKLPRRKDHMYSLSEFQEQLPAFEEHVRDARGTNTRSLSTYQRKLLDLDRKLQEIVLLRHAFTPTIIGDKNPMEDVMLARERVEALKRTTPPLVIPPADDKGKWTAYSTATFELWQRELMRAHGGDEASKSPMANMKIHPAVDRWSQIFTAYANQDAAAFNREVAGYTSELAAAPPSEYSARRVSFESFFNRAEPFYFAAVLYLFAFLLAVTGWIFAPAVLQRSAFWLLLFTLGLHTLALVGRMYISGRPPVTNLYSSAVFIGWGCVVLSLCLEMFHKLGIGSAVAGFAGFMTLLIAHYLSLDGDTFGVMQAVLDTQFWLATHVVTVAMGYATTFLAGLLGISYIALGLSTPKLDRDASKKLSGAIYGILCFAIFFSFVGTVLGGLWADDSWGRFWGWDPKENGALIIVLWNAVVLHARWGKMVGDRGLAVLAVLGNICTCWSWFGVNELGVGLHSYGFTEGVLMWLGIAAGTHLAIAAVGAFVPTQAWTSGPKSEDRPVKAEVVT